MIDSFGDKSDNKLFAEKLNGSLDLIESLVGDMSQQNRNIISPLFMMHAQSGYQVHDQVVSGFQPKT